MNEVPAGARAETLAGTGKTGLVQQVSHNRQLYLMLLPGILLAFIFQYIPIYGILIAFQDFRTIRGVFGSPFVGLKHFILFFQNPYFYRIVRNTFLINIYGLIFGFPTPIILALLLNEVPHLGYKKTIQTISYLPHFISTVTIVGILWRVFAMEGVVNNVLQGVGIKPVYFLASSRWFRSLYIGSGIWQGVGWGSIIYLAALTAVDMEVYEAAIMDGANRFRRIIHVNVPAILPTIMILLIFRLSHMLSVGFEKVYLMYSPATYEVADVISTYVFREGIANANFSYGAAVGFFNAIVSLTLIVMANFVAKRTTETSLW